MKNVILALSASLLVCASAGAMTVVGVGYEGAQPNCNIATGGHGVISNCSVNPNGTYVCDCEEVAPPSPGGSCTTAVGVGYEEAQSNCNIATGGRGTISNCSFNPNGSVVCSCCY